MYGHKPEMLTICLCLAGVMQVAWLSNCVVPIAAVPGPGTLLLCLAAVRQPS